MNLTIEEIRTEDMVLIMPKSFLGTSDAGEPLPAQVCSVINAMASQGWWPLDFGEEHEGGHVELWFVRGESVEIATHQAQYFIKPGGNV